MENWKIKSQQFYYIGFQLDMKYQSLRLNESLTFRFLQSKLRIIYKGNTFSQISYHNGDNHLAEKLHSVVYTEIEKLDLVQQL